MFGTYRGHTGQTGWGVGGGGFDVLDTEPGALEMTALCLLGLFKLLQETDVGDAGDADSPGCKETLGKCFHRFRHRTGSTRWDQRSQT